MYLVLLMDFFLLLKIDLSPLFSLLLKIDLSPLLCFIALASNAVCFGLRSYARYGRECSFGTDILIVFKGTILHRIESHMDPEGLD